MKLAAAIVLAFGVSAGAQASILTASFSGTVDDGTYANAPVGTSYAPGETISGSFQFDTTSDTFTSFTVGGYSAPGASTIYSPPLTATSFAYAGVEATDPTSASVTAELVLDFYYEATPFPNTTAIASFLQSPGAYSTDLAGGSPSQFNVFLSNPDGSVTTVGGLLTSYSASVAAVPEPASMAVLSASLLGLGLARRRQG